MNPTVQFLTAMGQALAGMSLYAPDHPMRAAARQRAHATLRTVLEARGSLRFSFLDGDVVVGTRVMHELRGWDWGERFARAGIQRVEIDALPLPSDTQLAHFFDALATQLNAPADSAFPSYAAPGFRAGSLGVSSRPDAAGADAVRALCDALAPVHFHEEVDAVDWVLEEAAEGRAIPMAEVEAVVRSLASAMHRDQHLIMPLLECSSADQYTTAHSCNVAMLSMGLAEQLGLPSRDVREIGTAALLHDIGKVRVPVEMLTKAGPLTDAEMQRVRQHPADGARLLSARGRGHALAAIVAYEHHVWENGTGGYPGFAFPRRCHVASRLVRVCNLYDALRAPRPYRAAWTREQILTRLQTQAGIEVDAEMVAAFVQMLSGLDALHATTGTILQR